MLLYANPKIDVLSFPEHPAEIVSVSKDGSVIRYSIDLNIDANKIVSQNAYTLVAQVLNKDPTSNYSKKKFKSASSWNKLGVAREQSVIKAAAKESATNVLMEKKIDLTRYISNDLVNAKTQSPTNDVRSLTRMQQNSIASLSVIATSTSPFTNASSVVIPSSPGIVSKSSSAVNVPRSPKISGKMLSMKADPASLTAKTFSTLTKSTKSIAASAASFVVTPPVQSIALQTVKFVPTKQKVTFTFSIKRSKLTSVSSFYLNLELENSIGLKIDEIKVQVPHARIYNNFITPRFAPALEAEYIKMGEISVKVHPNEKDRMARSIKVFRRTTGPMEGGSDRGTAWVEVFRSDIEGFTESTFRDKIATSRPVVYRAVAYGENFKPSESFSSTIVLPLKELKAIQTGALTAIPALSFRGSNTFAKIKVKDIPADVVAVMVRRYNLSTSSDSDRKASKGRGFEYVGASPERQVVSAEGLGPNDTIAFSDDKTKPGRKYSFVPVGITRAGKQIIGSSAILEVPNSPQRKQIQMSIKGPVVVDPSESNPSISFELSAKFTDFGFSEIRRALIAGRQKSLFDSNLLEDRSRFEKLISFLVERKNSRTGEEESFGVVEAGQFLDDRTTRLSLNVKPPEAGVEYTYKFVGLINSPETLFPDIASKEVDPRTLQAYTKSTAKFMNPQALFGATLMSNKRQLDPSESSPLGPSDPLLAGRTSVEKSIEFRVPLSSSARQEIKVEKYKGFNRLVWRVDGVGLVDHFKIYVVSAGGRVLIDTVHCDDASSEFYYRHYESGYGTNYQYVIVPISLAYEEMTAIKTSVIPPASALRRMGLSNKTSIVSL